MIGLDTNVLVRYFAQDDARQSAVASSLLERQLSAVEPGYISLVTLLETAWVLRASYGLTREELGRTFLRLLAEPSLRIQCSEAVSRAIDGYVNSAHDFADLLIATLDRDAGSSHTVTFDRKAARIQGMVLLIGAT